MVANAVIEVLTDLMIGFVSAIGGAEVLADANVKVLADANVNVFASVLTDLEFLVPKPLGEFSC